MNFFKTILELNAKYQASKFIAITFLITLAFKLSLTSFSTALIETFSTVFYVLIVYVSVILMVDFKKQIFAEIVSTPDYQIKTFLTWLFLTEYLVLFPFFKLDVSGFVLSFISGIVLTVFSSYYLSNIRQANLDKKELENQQENEEENNQKIEE
ncbi:TPA: hypothetical protein N0H21_001298 [Pseudomonas aeruginosa]|nr:hypothetical protein [Pseudomonas aeruginosa]